MSLRRVGVVGDVHAQDEMLASALAYFRDAGIDVVLSVGDLVDGEGDLERVVSLLDEAGALAVRGNHERWALTGQLRDLPAAHRLETCSERVRSYLAALPRTRSFETPRGRLLLGHGVGENDMARLGPDDEGYALFSNDALGSLLGAGAYAFFVGGHTHRRMVRAFESLVVFNAGTLLPGEGPCALVIDFDAELASFVDLGPWGVREAERVHWARLPRERFVGA